MKLLSRGINPSSLADIDLDQYSSDNDSRYQEKDSISNFYFSTILVMTQDQIHQLMMVYQSIWKSLQQLK
jgi:ubiquinone biosynthesis protein COQ9